MANTFGSIFRVTTFGESHGGAVGAVIDGCPPRIALGEDLIQRQLDRRRPGQSKLATARDEADVVKILSGVEAGRTLGTPIALMVSNRDARPDDYADLKTTPRPSHADYTYQMKYGIRAASGGGRASARETIGRVAAGAIAEEVLRVRSGVDIVAWVSAVGEVTLPERSVAELAALTRADVDAWEVRCPDERIAARMTAKIEQVRAAQDSIGGVVSCLCRGVPGGWGDPIFDKATARLAAAMLSIPATRGFEIGSGFAAAAMRGSEHNDPFVRKGSALGTKTNKSGGVQGGITNGEAILMRVAFKPPATIGLPQMTANFAGDEVVFEGRGRHDPCVVPRAVPIVEAMAALVLIDLALHQRALL